MISSAISNSTKLAMLGSVDASTKPLVTVVSRVVTSAPVPPATASLMASVADRLRITGGGEVVRFEGNVTMNLVMDPPSPPGRGPCR